VAAEASQRYLEVLKVDNPNELALIVAAGKHCPFTTEELKEMTSGVLIRSRVKPLLGIEWLTKSLTLLASVDCLKDKLDDKQVFTMRLIYGNFSVPLSVLYPDGYPSYGLADRDFILSTYKGSAEAAITDFIKAKFDL
jgi:hypothetical protein